MAEQSSGPAEVKGRPKYWDKMVSAAYLRIVGQTQAQAAKAVGRTERTIREWESSPLWPAAKAEARSRWLDEAGDKARKAVLDSLDMGNAELGKWLLERVEAALAPPKMRGDITTATVDLSALSESALRRIADGETLAAVLADERGLQP